MSQFKHKPINLEGHSFRLLRLLKAPFGNVQCELFNAYVDDESIVEYEALSYTWEGTYKEHDIEINGSIMAVTRNLSLALRSLRSPHQDRILWIDAICIDQDNDKERGHQVLQMASIYKKAEQVLVWLGPATPETDLMFDYMHRFEKEAFRYACRNWKVSDERWQKILSLVQTSHSDGKVDLTSEQREGLEDILTRSWFDRVWIIQEVANARAARVICGGNSVLGRTFALFPHLFGIAPSQHCQAILDVMPGPTRRHSWWTLNHDLNTLLLKFRGSKASDPRDKIYALLGISSDRSNKDFPVPDYGKSEAQVIQDTVTFILQLHSEKEGISYSPDWTLSDFIQGLELIANELFVRAAGDGSEATVKVLLDKKEIDINFKNKKGQTPLLRAAEHGHEAIVKLLLSKGACVNVQDEQGRTPLLLAAANGHEAAAKRLLSTGGADAEMSDTYGWKPLWAAAKLGRMSIIDLLLEIKEANALTPTHKEALETDKMLCRMLLETHENHLRHKSSGHGETPLWWAIQNRNTSLLKLLLEAKDFDINAPNDDGERLIPWVAHKKCTTALAMLLGAMKVNLYDTDEWAWELLKWAARTNDETTIRLSLATHRFDLFIKNPYGPLLFTLATIHDSKAVIKALLNCPKATRDLSRAEVLWRAADVGDESIVKSLLTKGHFNINYKLRYRQTPLWRAAWYGHTAVVELLLHTRGIELDTKDEFFQQTPLSMAVEHGHLEIVKLLLETKRVDLNSTDMYGRTPSVIAVNSRRKDIADLLERYQVSG